MNKICKGIRSIRTARMFEVRPLGETEFPQAAEQNAVNNGVIKLCYTASKPMVITAVKTSA